MELGWQEIATGALVAGAVAWLVGDRLRKRRAGAACDSCALMEAARRATPPGAAPTKTAPGPEAGAVAGRETSVADPATDRRRSTPSAR